MKNTDKKNWCFKRVVQVTFKIVLFLMCLPFILVFIAILGIFIWEPNIIPVTGCLDNGGRWDYELRECEYAPEGALLYPYACTQAGQIWDQGTCQYSKEYADQYPAIKPYKK